MLNQEDDIVVEVLIYGSPKFNTNKNFRLLSSSINYILKSVVLFHNMVKAFLSVFCHTFVLNFISYGIVTKLIDQVSLILSTFISVFNQKKKKKKIGIAQSFIIYAVIGFLVHLLLPYCYVSRLIRVLFCYCYPISNCLIAFNG